MEKISHNLELAKPMFRYYIAKMDKELSQWIQYTGYEEESNRIYFLFKSSQNSLSFSVYGGIVLHNSYTYILDGKFNEIYQYFRELKYNTLQHNETHL